MTMAMRNFRHLMGCNDGAAAIEASILLPLYLTLTIGLVDLGTSMFGAMQMNAAAQAGAASAVMDPTLAGVNGAVTAATGGYKLNAVLTTWTIAGGVVTVTTTCDTGAGGSCAPILPWSQVGSFIKTTFPAHLASTVTVRIE